MRNILVIFLLVASSVTFGQSDSSKYAVQMSITNGWSYRSLNSSNSEMNQVIEGLNEIEKGRYVMGFEAVLMRHLSKNFTVQSGLSYHTLGHRVDTLVELGIENITYTLKYIQIPVSARFNFLEENKVSPYIQLGGQYGLLVGDVMEYKIRGANRSSRVVNEGEWQKHSFSLIGGAGVQVELDPSNAFIAGVQGQYAVNASTKTELKRSYYDMSLLLGWVIKLRAN